MHPTARAREAKVTESAVHSGTHAVHVNASEASTQPARVVPEVFVPPTAAPPQPSDYADEIRIPDGLDEVNREEWVKAAIVARQKAINVRHLKELQAARSLEVVRVIEEGRDERGCR